MCKVLENKSLSDEARMEALENQLKEPEYWQRKLTKNTMKSPKNWSQLSLILNVQKNELIPVSTRSLSLRRSWESLVTISSHLKFQKKRPTKERSLTKNKSKP